MDRRPAGPRFRSDEPYEHGGQAAFACSDQRDGSPKRQTLRRITGSFLATATCALPLPDRLAMACRQSFKTRGFLEPRQDHDSSLIHQSASVLRPASSTTQIAVIFCETSNPTKWVIDEPPMMRITGRHCPNRGTIGRSPPAIIGCLHMTEPTHAFCLITGTFPV
jgi:hypothetical protein